MTATGHAVLGSIIAAKIGNPALAIPIALASHFLADAIPHWDTGTNARKKTKKRLFTESVLDVFIGLGVSFFIISVFFPDTDLQYAFLMVFISQLPDWLMSPYYFFGLNIPPFNWTYRFQKIFDRELDKPWGVATQGGAILIVFLLAKLF